MKHHYAQFGEILKTRREARGLSQTELSRLLGIQASYVAYLENGERRPSIPVIGRVADVMGDARKGFTSHDFAEHGGFVEAVAHR